MLVEFRTSRGKVGLAGLLRDSWGSPAPLDGLDDVLVSFWHDNGDGTDVVEDVVWSVRRMEWARRPLPGEAPVWGASLREVLYRRHMSDEDVADAVTYFGDDPAAWVLALSVMSS